MIIKKEGAKKQEKGFFGLRIHVFSGLFGFLGGVHFWK
jgi:hypothetical protein